MNGPGKYGQGESESGNSNSADAASALDPKRELFRHALATLAYRGGKTVRDIPEGLLEFQAGAGVRTPGQILAHVGDLLDWALSIAVGQQKWHDSNSCHGSRRLQRFFAALKKFDDFLASSEPCRLRWKNYFKVRSPMRSLMSDRSLSAATGGSAGEGRELLCGRDCDRKSGRGAGQAEARVLSESVTAEEHVLPARFKLPRFQLQ